MSNLEVNVIENATNVLAIVKDDVVIELDSSELTVLLEKLTFIVRSDKLKQSDKVLTKAELKRLTPSEFIKSFGLEIAKNVVRTGEAQGAREIGTGQYIIGISELSKHIKSLEAPETEEVVAPTPVKLDSEEAVSPSSVKLDHDQPRDPVKPLSPSLTDFTQEKPKKVSLWTKLSTRLFK